MTVFRSLFRLIGREPGARGGRRGGVRGSSRFEGGCPGPKRPLARGRPPRGREAVRPAVALCRRVPGYRSRRTKGAPPPRMVGRCAAGPAAGRPRSAPRSRFHDHGGAGPGARHRTQRHGVLGAARGRAQAAALSGVAGADQGLFQQPQGRLGLLVGLYGRLLRLVARNQELPGDGGLDRFLYGGHRHRRRRAGARRRGDRGLSGRQRGRSDGWAKLCHVRVRYRSAIGGDPLLRDLAPPVRARCRRAGQALDSGR